MYIDVYWSRDFIVGIESRLRSWGLGFEYRQGQGVFVFSTTWRPVLGPIKLSLQWKLTFILWGKAAGAWIFHSPPLDSEVKNEWNYTFTPSVCLHDMDRNNFTLSYKRKFCQGQPAIRWRPLTAFRLKILHNVSSIGSGAGIAASSRRGSILKGAKVSILYKYFK